MGLGALFNRDTQYVATDLSTGDSQTFTVIDNITADWSNGEYQGGMGIPGAWRSAILLSDLLGGVPWHAYRSVAGGTSVRMDPTPPLLAQPAPPDTRMTTFSSMMLDLIWHGNGIAIIAARNREGWPVAMLPCPAEYVQVRRVGQADTEIALPRGAIVYGIGDRWYPASDVVHVKGPCRPGALRGMGVLENHLNKTLWLADEQSRQARSLGTSGVPTGVLKSTDPDFEQDDADELKAGWLRSQRDRTVAVLNSTTEFEALAWNPTETQLLEARKFSLHEIALLFGLDPSWLGVAGDSMTYQNIEAKATDLVKFSLHGHLQRFEQTFTLHMPRGIEARANLDAILRGDTLTRYQAHEIAIRSGFETDDEARAMENRPPLTAAQRAARTPAAKPPAAGQLPTSEGDAA